MNIQNILPICGVHYIISINYIIVRPGALFSPNSNIPAVYNYELCLSVGNSAAVSCIAKEFLFLWAGVYT